MSGPLDGLKVLDIATIVVASLAATLLADYGADVLGSPGKRWLTDSPTAACRALAQQLGERLRRR